MFGQHMSHELSAFDIQGYGMDIAEPPYFSFHLDETTKWNGADVPYPYRRVPTPLLIPDNHPHLTAEPQSQAVPAMTTEGSSTKSSPISPYTPGTNGNYDVQNPYGAGFAHGSMSPYDAAPPGAGAYAADGQSFYGMQGYSSSSAVSRPVGGGPIEMDASSTTRPYAQLLTNDPSGSNEFYQEPGQEMTTSQVPDADPRSLHHGMQDHRVGTFEMNESGWYRRPMHRERVQDMDDDRHLLNQQILNEIQQALGSVDNSRHQPPPQQSSATITQTLLYAPVACEVCGTQFNGKYRFGNLKRHFNGFHKLFKSKTGMTCRVCKKEYKRPDAARKHERNNHGFSDARSTTRRRGKAPAAM